MNRIKLIVLAAVATAALGMVAAGCQSLCGVPVLGMFSSCSPTPTETPTDTPVATVVPTAMPSAS